MDTAFEFLKANKVFHIGTTDGAKGRVRPFAFVMKRNNTIYFCTGKMKEVYKQMSQYPGHRDFRDGLGQYVAQDTRQDRLRRHPRCKGTGLRRVRQPYKHVQERGRRRDIRHLLLHRRHGNALFFRGAAKELAVGVEDSPQALPGHRESVAPKGNSASKFKIEGLARPADPSILSGPALTHSFLFRPHSPRLFPATFAEHHSEALLTREDEPI